MITSNNQPFEYAIIGAGPGGLQLASCLERRGANYVVLEAGPQAGSFFGEYPRHGQLISINKINTGCDDYETNLRWDWNSLLGSKPLSFRSYSERFFPSRQSMVKYLADFARAENLNIQFGCKTNSIAKDGDGFVLTSETGLKLRARVVVVATGLSRPNTPDFPGVELGTHYVDFEIDPAKYKNKRVLIVGKGNSAFETADAMIEYASSIHLCSPHPTKLAWATHYVGNVRAVNNNFLDTYQLKSQNVILDAVIQSLEPEAGGVRANIVYTHAMEERRSVWYDQVLLCTGFRMDRSIFDSSCLPEVTTCGRLPMQTCEWESTNVPDLFFVGTLMQMRDYKKTMSGFIHGFRHNALALDSILAAKYEGKPWTGVPLESSTETIADTILDRLNRSAAIFLQPGYLCDLIVQQPDGMLHLVEGVPKDYVRSSSFFDSEMLITISLEYGDFSKIADPFNIDREPFEDKAHLAAYLHPILRIFERGELIQEKHLLEDLENDYSGPLWRERVLEFVSQHLFVT
ncbi:MAG: NAD(P)-binding domain-containing protein [Planctomycetales bacterium]|nr:NAD(P)-binding domain-containing protein [Planctomycetales bacterium]